MDTQEKKYMKKLILAMTTIAIIAVACSKVQTKVEPTSTQTIKTTRGDANIRFNNVDYQIQNGILTFETFDKYENLFEVDDPTTLQPFADQVEHEVAMTSYTETSISSEQKDELHFIGKIVNEEGLIKIDVFTILLDFNRSEIYATKTGSIQDLINAKNGNIASNVFEMSMNETETIDELRELKTRGLFCKESYATSKYKEVSSNDGLKTSVLLGDEDQNATHDKKVELFTSVRYSQYGLYYELNSKYWPTSQVAANNINPPHTWVTTYWWQRRCSSASGSATNTSSSATTVYGFSPAVAKNLIYGNVKALKHYNVTSTVSSSVSVPSGASKSVNIND